jgi:hypothetical protein
MTDPRVPGSGREPRDEGVVRLLRARYAPPADPAYWDALESRILGGIAERGSVWSWLAGWAPIGVAAAAVAALIAGLAVVQTRDAEATVAYEAAMQTAAPLPVQTVSRAPGISEREATLEYVISF